MESTTRHASAPVAFGQLKSRLALRISGPDFGQRLVSFSEGQCTIGSGEHCTLRVEAPGVESVHCLIVRDQQRTTVYPNAETTWLNNRPFADGAILVAGDRLRLGSVEIEVLPATLEPVLVPHVNAQRADRVGSPAGDQLAELAARYSDLERVLDARQIELDAQAEELDRRRAAWEAEQARWAKARRESEDAWLGQCARWNMKHARAEAELDVRAAELHATWEAHRREHCQSRSTHEIEQQTASEQAPGSNRCM